MNRNRKLYIKPKTLIVVTEGNLLENTPSKGTFHGEAKENTWVEVENDEFNQQNFKHHSLWED